jgi:hypothetical protein
MGISISGTHPIGLSEDQWEFQDPKRTLKGDFISFLTGKRVSYILCCGKKTPFALAALAANQAFTIGT